MSDNNTRAALHASGHAYRPAHFAPPVFPSWRRSLCAAGLAAVIAVAVAPAAAFADGLGEIPDAGWTPDVPAIEPGTDGGGEPDVPETPVDPEPQPEPTPDTDSGGSGGTVPDSGGGVPSYEETYPGGGSADTIGAGEGAFFDPEVQAQQDASAQDAAPVESAGTQQAEAPVASDLVSAPVFGGYDAATGTVSATVAPGSVVRFVDAAGNVLGDVAADADGNVWLALPAGTDVSTISLYVVDPATGARISEELTGASIAQQLAERELAAVRSEVGASTSLLAGELKDALASSGVAAAIEQEQTSMPIVPYMLGAASALLAVGVVGGVGTVVYRSVRHRGEEDVFLDPEPVRQWAESEAEAVPRAPVPNGARSGAHAAPAADGDIDELELIALGIQGTPSAPRASSGSPADAPGAAGFPPAPDDDGPGGGGVRPDSTDAFLAVAPPPVAAPAVGVLDPSESRSARGSDGGDSAHGPTTVGFAPGESPDSTIPCPRVQEPVDPEVFARTAHILATGSGPVHRIVSSTSDLDLSGLDLFDESRTPVSPHAAADPMVEHDDWRSIALAELASDVPPAAPVAEALSTDGYLDLIRTKRNDTVRPAADATSYVAPVVGPSFVSSEDVQRRRELLERASTPEAEALRTRDEEFLRQRAARGGSSRPTSTPGPVQRLPLAGRSLKDGPVLAGRPPVDPSVAAAVSAARSAYAAFAPASARQSPAWHGSGAAIADSPVISQNTAFSAAVPTGSAPDSTEVSHAVAAAYAAAVYANVAAPMPREGARDQAGRGSSAAAVPSVSADDDATLSSDDPGATSSLSPAYIDYLVQEEFSHRHDTIAQRNAALGHMHVVNGAATAPVSVREGVALHRYMA